MAWSGIGDVYMLIMEASKYSLYHLRGSFIVGTSGKLTQSSSQPRCTWVDGDRTNGIRTKMLFIHFPSFVGVDGKPRSPSSYCGWPALRAYDNGGGSIFKKRDGDGAAHLEAGSTIKKRADTRLVVSSFPGHNATELCESETSRGPDFVSTTEGVFCNMESRKVQPLCKGDLEDGCFSLVGATERSKGGSGKAYSEVIQW